MAKNSDAKIKANNRYDKRAYFRTMTRFRKDLEDQIRDAASSAGESLNGYIVHAVIDRMRSEGFDV